MWYVYHYLREDGTPFYVGKGTGSRINSDKGRSYELPPKDRRVIVKEFDDETECLLYEVEEIKKYGRICDGGILINQQLHNNKGCSGHTFEKRKRDPNRPSRQTEWYRKKSQDPEYKKQQRERVKRDYWKRKEELHWVSSIIGDHPL